MNPDVQQPDPLTAGEQPFEAAPAAPGPPDLWAGARGALIVIALSGLLIAGLWLISRNAPSAETDPRLLPTPIAETGPNPFRDQTFVTVAPAPRSAPANGTEES